MNQSNIYAIDLGNRQIKLRLMHGNLLKFSYTELELLKPHLKPDYFYNCISVLTPKKTNEFLSLLPANSYKLWNAYEILSNALPKHADKLHHIGSDRALKIYSLSQFDLNHPQMSIGLGSAFTIELIDTGYLVESIIIPGLNLQLKSLSQYTGLLPNITQADFDQILNTSNKISTKYAMLNGILRSFIALIQSLIKKYPNLENIILSGADAYLIKNQIRFDLLHYEDNYETLALLKLCSQFR